MNGYLVSTVDEAAGRIVDLCEKPELAEAMGRAGRERVRQRFLTTRLLEDWLRLLGDVMADRSASSPIAVRAGG